MLYVIKVLEKTQHYYYLHSMRKYHVPAVFIVLLWSFLIPSHSWAQIELGEPNPTPALELGLFESGARFTQARLRVIIPAASHISLQPEYFTFSILSAGGVNLTSPPTYPPGHFVYDGIDAYRATVDLSAHFITDLAPGDLSGAVVAVTWQICRDDGLCYPPETQTWGLKEAIDPSSGFVQALVVRAQVSKTSALALPLVRQDVPTEQPGMNLFIALVFAFVGGLILNLMPCVLPVLSLKALSLVKGAESTAKRNRAKAFSGYAGTLFALQILAVLSFLLQSGGSALGWGFQFQSPWYGLILVLVLTVFALNLFGVWELRGPVLGLKSPFGKGLKGASSGMFTAFWGGVMTVLLATPCSAPFLGTALGFTLTAPWWLTMLTFLALGLGLGLPMFLVTLVPGFARILPRPGPWMTGFKAFLGFALLGTSVWLITVLNAQVSPQAFAVMLWILLFSGFACWFWGHVQTRPWPGPRKLLALLGIVAVLSAGFITFAASLTPQADTGWEPFSNAALAEAQAQGQDIFIDFTASWCLTCQVNKASTLSRPEVLAAFNRAGVRRFVADWTNPDREIEAALASFGRNAVPLYVFLQPGAPPLILPEILDPAMLLNMLESRTK